MLRQPPSKLLQICFLVFCKKVISLIFSKYFVGCFFIHQNIMYYNENVIAKQTPVNSPSNKIKNTDRPFFLLPQNLVKNYTQIITRSVYAVCKDISAN